MIEEAHYIRTGAWCACCRSCNAVTGQLEAGLSVYECDRDSSGWRPLGEAWSKRKLAVGNHFLGRKLWYLVTGRRLATDGSDNEPLLAEVKFASMLQWESKPGVFLEIQGPAPKNCKHDGYEDGVCRCEQISLGGLVSENP